MHPSNAPQSGHEEHHGMEPELQPSFLAEFRDYLGARKRWWLLPLFILLLLIGGLLALAAKHAVIAPFIYTLF